MLADTLAVLSHINSGPVSADAGTPSLVLVPIVGDNDRGAASINGSVTTGGAATSSTSVLNTPNASSASTTAGSFSDASLEGSATSVWDEEDASTTAASSMDSPSSSELRGVDNCLASAKSTSSAQSGSEGVAVTDCTQATSGWI